MSGDGLAPAGPVDPPAAEALAGPLGLLPRLTRREVELDRRLGPAGPALARDLVAAWNDLIGGGMVADRFAVQWRAAGLRRPGVVAHLAWPRFRSRVALGVDPPLAHALVDRLLGFERTPAEAHLQVSPTEWGVLAFVVASGMDQLDGRTGPLGPWDLTIDRVGPDPFDLASLGPIVTWRWRVRVGPIAGSARLWFPESLLLAWLDADVTAPRYRPESADGEPSPPIDLRRYAELHSQWHAQAGTITLDAVAGTPLLGPGRLLLIDGSPLTGTVASPEGPVDLVQRGRTSRSRCGARVEPGSAGTRLIITSSIERIANFQTPFMANAHESPQTGPTPAAGPGPRADAAPSATAPADLAVTLTVELGRVNLSLHRLAELRPGDVVELNRQPGEPVDLASNGRLVARGELVQVDTELGVRITQVYL